MTKPEPLKGKEVWKLYGGRFEKKDIRSAVELRKQRIGSLITWVMLQSCSIPEMAILQKQIAEKLSVLHDSLNNDFEDVMK